MGFFTKILFNFRKKPPSIQDWPDLVLLELFSCLPISDQLHLGQTCRHFKALQEEACRYRVRAITIRSNCVKGKRCATLNCLHLHDLSSNICEKLIILLPNITSLTIHYSGSPKQLSKSYILLNYWCQSLVNLKLFVNMKVSNQQEFFRLFAKIQAMSALKHLRFDYPGYIMPRTPNQRWPQLRLPILSRLESFIFYTNDPISIILRSLSVYANNNAHLREVKLRLDVQFNEEFDQILGLNLNIVQAITGYSRIVPLDLPVHRFTEFFSQLPSLTMLHLYWTHHTIGQLSAALQPLAGLVRLELIVDIALQTQLREEALLEGRLIEPDVPELLPLPQVKHLTLSLYLADHSDINQLRLKELFPNLESIELQIVVCEKCDLISQVPPYNRKRDQLLTCIARISKAYRNDNKQQNLHEAFPRLQKITFKIVYGNGATFSETYEYSPTKGFAQLKRFFFILRLFN